MLQSPTNPNRPSTSPAEGRAFDERWADEVRVEARRILILAGTIVVPVLLGGFTLNFALKGDAPGFEVARVGAPLQMLVLACGTAALRFLPVGRTHPHLVGGVSVAIFGGLSGYSLGALGGMDGPFFYVAYLLPCVTLGLPAALMTRVAFTVAILGSFLLVFFASYPQHLNAPFAHIAWVHLTAITAAYLYFGNLLHTRARTLFALRRAAELKSANLSQSNDALVEEVKLRTERLVAATDQAEHIRTQERQGLARALHDDMGQLLVSARASLARLGERVELASVPEIAGLADIVADLERSASEVTEALRNAELPFEVAVDDLVEMFQALEVVDIDVELDCVEWEPPEETRQVALRVIQESLTNVLKHAEATHVQVTVRRQRTYLEVIVSDDGAGMGEAAGATGGFGLMGMRERLRQIGGALRIESEDRGVTIRATLPLMEPEAGKRFP